MSIFGHQHRYEAVAVDGHAIPFSGKSTIILFRCRCNDVYSKTLAGEWTLSQVRGGTAGRAASQGEEVAALSPSFQHDLIRSGAGTPDPRG